MPASEIARDDLLAGRVYPAIAALLAAERPPAVEPTGIDEVADLLEPWLRRTVHMHDVGRSASIGTSCLS
jgi:hypothetical protein